MNILIDRNDNNYIERPTSFFYIPQGTYRIKPIDKNVLHGFYYSDSATSCIIVIVIGKLIDGGMGFAMAHLDSSDCISYFFRLVDNNFSDQLKIFAQGANPKNNHTSKINAASLLKNIKDISERVKEEHLFLLEGDPKENNRGQWGIHIESSETLIVSNQGYNLELTDRDPFCGLQSLYSIMRRSESPIIQLRDAEVPFSYNEVIELVKIALTYQSDPSNFRTSFVNIINLQEDDILNFWSSTPKYEAPWFVDQLKQAACFALSLSANTKLYDSYMEEI